jgi:hypothetical protein
VGVVVGVVVGVSVGVPVGVEVGVIVGVFVGVGVGSMYSIARVLETSLPLAAASSATLAARDTVTNPYDDGVIFTV